MLKIVNTFFIFYFLKITLLVLISITIVSVCYYILYPLMYILTFFNIDTFLFWSLFLPILIILHPILKRCNFSISKLIFLWFLKSNVPLYYPANLGIYLKRRILGVILCNIIRIATYSRNRPTFHHGLRDTYIYIKCTNELLQQHTEFGHGQFNRWKL